MAVVDQLNLNIGTEQNPNMVLHDIHDKRISSTDVTTVTRLLGCDAGVNSIAPLTLANAASLLGENLGLTKIQVDAGNAVPTGINVNAYNRGKSILILFSCHGSSGDNTGSGLYMVRCGYNGNNYNVKEVSVDYKYESYKPTFSVDASGVLLITSSVAGYAECICNK